MCAGFGQFPQSHALLFVLGGTSVLVAVQGPRAASSMRRESPDEMTIAVTVKPATGTPGPPEKHMQSQLGAALAALVTTKAFPRTVLDVTVHILGDDGSALALALVAAGLAVGDAGVPVRGLLLASCVAARQEGGVVLDPTAEEADTAACVVTAAFLGSPGAGDDVLASQVTGTMDPAELPGLLATAHAAAVTAGEFFKLSIRQLVARDHGELVATATAPAPAEEGDADLTA